ncbi:MAG TPA: hypothetical protein VF533_05550 [Solirubrobacteraceae bacterium]
MRQVFRRLRVPSLPTAISLLALSIAVTGTAWAATGQLVNIADGTNAARLAKVSQYGSLQVGDGSGALTVDGTTTSRQALPQNFVRFSRYVQFANSCTPVITAPANRALVITDIVAGMGATGATNSIASFYTDGCSDQVQHVFGLSQHETKPVPLGPGIVIPAGKSLEIYASAGGLYASGFGYSIPAADAPASKLQVESSGRKPTD